MRLCASAVQSGWARVQYRGMVANTSLSWLSNLMSDASSMALPFSESSSRKPSLMQAA